MAIYRFLVHAGPHERRHCPVEAELPEKASLGTLVRDDTGAAVPGQIHDGRLHFILDRLVAGRQCALRLDTAKPPAAGRAVRLKHKPGDRQIEVRIGRKLLTTYYFGAEFPRPFFYPLIGPHGVPMTRHYPMRDDVHGETKDHKHHRSVWVAFGDVNGTDNWAEKPGHGWQVHTGLDHLVSGPVFGQWRQELTWEDHNRRDQLKETRTVRFYQSPESARLMDLDVAFHATCGPVRFGDTKEGGICSVRVATTMDGSKGGRIENSYGGVGEGETWGKPAHWCDYSGQAEGKHIGIAIFDHPMNLRHPTPWHVRNYGLMTANPFGHGDYQSGLLKDGSHTIGADQTLTFRYRLYLHKFDAKRGLVGARYHDYVNPPVVELA